MCEKKFTRRQQLVSSTKISAIQRFIPKVYWENRWNRFDNLPNKIVVATAAWSLPSTSSKIWPNSSDQKIKSPNLFMGLFNKPLRGFIIDHLIVLRDNTLSLVQTSRYDHLYICVLLHLSRVTIHDSFLYFSKVLGQKKARWTHHLGLKQKGVLNRMATYRPLYQGIVFGFQLIFKGIQPLLSKKREVFKSSNFFVRCSALVEESTWFNSPVGWLIPARSFSRFFFHNPADFSNCRSSAGSQRRVWRLLINV